ncbi:50S ribosomal protein L4 [[Clostridium] colinum]|uniref:50S ribosomal protein L4 n=1 Tax=[Clostridium] colinum TaxID=36835 RepID=UPI00202478C6|nr:50S ribosomal protein L4 [[Clostridium] colinum]
MAITVKVLNMSGSEVGSIELNENIFGVEVNEHVMHQAVVQYLANQRQGTKSAKTRAEVRGGGRKPWRQKGTGRARQGSIRSPQWTGGGVVFAPKPRDFSFKLNKKVKRLALKSALTTKVNNEKFIVVDELKLNEIKTKEMKKVLDNLNVNKGLVVLEENNKNVLLSARNIPNVKTAGVNTINVYDILKYESFVVTKEALAKIEEVYK